MEDKNYWWAKLPETFFTNNEVEIIWTQKGGEGLCAIFLRLLLLTLRHSGELRYSETKGYSIKELALFIHKPEKEVQLAYDEFFKAGFWHFSDDGTLVFDHFDEFVGHETDVARRVRKSRANKADLQGFQENERYKDVTLKQPCNKNDAKSVTSTLHCNSLPAPSFKSRKSLRDKEIHSPCSPSFVGSQADGDGEHGELIKRSERFYDAFPKKSGKDPVDSWFAKNPMTAAEFEGLMIALSRSKSQRSWNREGGRFIPLAQNWLEKRCWTDDDVALGAETIRQSELARDMSDGPEVSVDVSAMMPKAREMKESGK